MPSHPGKPIAARAIIKPGQPPPPLLQGQETRFPLQRIGRPVRRTFSRLINPFRRLF